MWMCYSEAARPSAVDVQSAVDRLKGVLEDHAVDMAHEKVYGLGRYYSEKECDELEQKYANGVCICELYLEEKIKRERFIRLMIGLGLETFLDEVNEFIDREEEAAENGERN